MWKMLFSAIAVVVLLTTPALAEAASFSMPSSDGITLVSGGCGPGGFRAGNGLCYRRPGRAYFRRACPPGLHLTRFGCRRYS